MNPLILPTYFYSVHLHDLSRIKHKSLLLYLSNAGYAYTPLKNETVHSIVTKTCTV